MTADDHEAFKQAYADTPSQDNEGWVPDRGSYKAGFFAALNYERARLRGLYGPAGVKHLGTVLLERAALQDQVAGLKSLAQQLKPLIDKLVEEK